MSTPEAIRLADELDRLFDQLDPVDDWRPHVSDAGDELRRLSALNAELVEALKRIDNAAVGDPECMSYSEVFKAIKAERALIAKAEGGAA